MELCCFKSGVGGRHMGIVQYYLYMYITRTLRGRAAQVVHIGMELCCFRSGVGG